MVQKKINKYIVGPYITSKGLYAGNKFPKDVFNISEKMGYVSIFVHERYSKKRLWQPLIDLINLSKIKRNSKVIYIDQVYPHLSRRIVYWISKKKKVDFIPLLEDVDIIRNNELSDTVKAKTIHELNSAKCIISQTSKMSDYLKENGVRVPTIELQVLDFLVPSIKKEKYVSNEKRTICYGGNLSKVQSGFLKNIKISSKDHIQYYIYGNGEMKSSLPEGMLYKGYFSPENCVKKLKGDWGLVWNGESIKINEQDPKSIYYNYVCPHKFSMYAICGMPVIVYANAAMAKFVKDFECGIIINNINEIPDRLKNIKLQQYLKYRRNMLNIALKIAKGEFTTTAISKAENKD